MHSAIERERARARERESKRERERERGRERETSKRMYTHISLRLIMHIRNMHSRSKGTFDTRMVPGSTLRTKGPRRSCAFTCSSVCKTRTGPVPGGAWLILISMMLPICFLEFWRDEAELTDLCFYVSKVPPLLRTSGIFQACQHANHYERLGNE